MAKKEGIPAWVWIGCGCLLFPALVAVVIGGFGFFAFNYGKNAIDKMADPEKRAAAALETLGAKALPEGFHVRTYFAIPFGFSLVVLGDGTPAPAPQGDSFEEKAKTLESLDLGNLGDNRRIFLFLRLHQKDDASIEEILNNKRSGNGVNLDLGVKFESDRELARGDLEVAGRRVAFESKAGRMDTRGPTYDVFYTELSFDCPDKERRLGLLVELLPDGQASAATADPPAEAVPSPTGAPGGRFAGTVADAQVVQALVGGLDVCH